MPSYGLTLLLRDDEETIERYKDHHRQVWPEVLDRLREVGIEEMKIFLIGRRLFMYLRARDDFVPERDFPRLSDHEPTKRWEELMTSMQERVPEAADGEWWARMEEVFDLQWDNKRPKVSSSNV